jgi:small-conductance mechanosensitive channel
MENEQQIVRQTMSVGDRVAALLASIGEQALTWALTSGLRIVMICILAWVGVRLIAGASSRLHKTMVGSSSSLERIKRADTVIGIVRTVAVILVVTAAGMMALRETGIDIAPMLATAGIGGLAVGFGAQTLVKDVISGFFMLVEEQVRVGDIVEVAGKSGIVESISLRTLRLRDESANVHVIPHGNVTLVTNLTKDYSRYVVDVQIARREDPDRVFELLREIGDDLQKDEAYGADILQPIEVLGVNELTATTVTVRARLTTRSMKRWRIGREFNRRMKKRFDEAGVALT